MKKLISCMLFIAFGFTTSYSQFFTTGEFIIERTFTSVGAIKLGTNGAYSGNQSHQNANIDEWKFRRQKHSIGLLYKKSLFKFLDYRIGFNFNYDRLSIDKEFYLKHIIYEIPNLELTEFEERVKVSDIKTEAVGIGLPLQLDFTFRKNAKVYFPIKITPYYYLNRSQEITYSANVACTDVFILGCVGGGQVTGEIDQNKHILVSDWIPQHGNIETALSVGLGFRLADRFYMQTLIETNIRPFEDNYKGIPLLLVFEMNYVFKSIKNKQ